MRCVVHERLANCCWIWLSCDLVFEIYHELEKMDAVVAEVTTRASVVAVDSLLRGTGDEDFDGLYVVLETRGSSFHLV